jgi:hypothetical protein
MREKRASASHLVKREKRAQVFMRAQEILFSARKFFHEHALLARVLKDDRINAELEKL